LKGGEIMSILNWTNSNIKKLTWSDMGLVKLAIFAFTLMLAKLLPDLLSFEWYWYFIVFLLAAIKPWSKFFKN
jgi:hypothetical protein